MQKINDFQLDIFGNFKSLSQINREKKLDEKYKRKIIKFKKDFVKSGGVLNVNKAFVRTD